MRGGIASSCWLRYVIGHGAVSSKAEAIQEGGGIVLPLLLKYVSWGFVCYCQIHVYGMCMDCV